MVNSLPSDLLQGMHHELWHNFLHELIFTCSNLNSCQVYSLSLGVGGTRETFLEWLHRSKYKAKYWTSPDEHLMHCRCRFLKDISFLLSLITTNFYGSAHRRKYWSWGKIMVAFAWTSQHSNAVLSLSGKCRRWHCSKVALIAGDKKSRYSVPLSRTLLWLQSLLSSWI